MAVRVKPVKVRKKQKSAAIENAVHFYRRDVDAAPRSTGSFLGAFVRHSGVDTLFCQTFDSADYEDFAARMAKLDDSDLKTRYVPLGSVSSFQEAPVLRIADGPVGPLVWRRRAADQRLYSVISEINHIGPAAVQSLLIDLLTAPVQPWDCLIFPTRTLRDTAEEILGRSADYLSARVGGEATVAAKRFIVPPGINVDAYEPSTETAAFGQGVRHRLGIAEDDLCVVSVGHFSFYDRQHPTPAFLGLEAAARRTGTRIHHLMAGWFDSERTERAYRDLARQIAPAVNTVFLDGRDPEIRRGAWVAADAYAAFNDSVMQQVDFELLEAMASGLAVVASDWGSNRDFIVDGEDGFLIPTALPVAKSGGDLALSPETLIERSHERRAETFVSGLVGQMTAIDHRRAADVFTALADDAELRRRIGENAREKIREQCSWPTIIRRHQAIWSELRRLREQETEVAPLSGQGAVFTGLNDPFEMFRSFATQEVTGESLIKLSAGLKRGEGIIERLNRLRANPINGFATDYLLDGQQQEELLTLLSETKWTSVQNLAAHLEPLQRYRLPRTVTWWMKMGLIEGADDDDIVDQKAEGASPSEATLKEPEQNPEQDQNVPEVAEDDVLRRLDIGRAMVLRGDVASGIARLQAVVDEVPGNAEARFQLGAALRRAGAAEDAVRHLERSAMIAPKRIDTLLHLAHARIGMGRRAEALQAFRDALRLEPMNMFARAGEISLGAEADGRRIIERDAMARRVGLYFSGSSEFHPLLPLFASLQGRHWPLLTSDGRTLSDFKPDVVVTGGTDTARLRDMLPNALIVVVPMFLASQNRFPRAFADADIICAPSEILADAWYRLGYSPGASYRITGYLPTDRLLSGEMPETPPLLRGAGPTVLYAPTFPEALSSREMLGSDPVSFLCGKRRDVTLVVKFHPKTIASPPPWLEQWIHIADQDPRVALITDPDADTLPYLRAADVLVTDASTVMFDYLAVDRPILLLKPKGCETAAEVYDPLGIEWRWREVGREINDLASLPKEVNQALKAPETGAEVRARYLSAVVGERASGRATERIANVISELST